MELFPAIDLIGGCAVRLVRGDYGKKTVYSEEPAAVASAFAAAGARYLHVVDLEGARDGGTPNMETIREIARIPGLRMEVGGGIRSEKTIEDYLAAGVFRVVLGTAAIEEPEFLKAMVERYGDQIAVGVDIRDGKAAVRGWTRLSEESSFSFCGRLEQMGVKTVICTDISKDGLLSGANMELYRTLTEQLSMDIVASGGVSTLEDIRMLRGMGLSGAILGKALYEGKLDLRQALEEAGRREAASETDENGAGGRAQRGSF